MPTVPDHDYWTIAPAATSDRPPGRTNPLAFLNPGECGAWVATLQALRALPNTSLVPPPRSRIGIEEGEPSAITADPEQRVPDLDNACGT
jgi:hypothetical protein